MPSPWGNERAWRGAAARGAALRTKGLRRHDELIGGALLCDLLVSVLLDRLSWIGIHATDRDADLRQLRG